MKGSQDRNECHWFYSEWMLRIFHFKEMFMSRKVMDFKFNSRMEVLYKSYEIKKLIIIH